MSDPTEMPDEIKLELELKKAEIELLRQQILAGLRSKQRTIVPYTGFESGVHPYQAPQREER
jgi:hypothetical protein